MQKRQSDILSVALPFLHFSEKNVRAGTQNHTLGGLQRL